MSKAPATRKRTRHQTPKGLESSAMRNATLQTWQPNGQITRILKRTRIPFHTPAQIIRAAVQMCPDWDPVSISVFASSTERGCVLAIHFGADDSGETTEVYVDIAVEESRLLLLHMLGSDHVMQCATGTWTTTPEDDGGEELPVPTADARLIMSPISEKVM